MSNAALMSSDSNTNGVLLSVVDSRSLTTLVIAVSVECSEYADCRGAALVELSVCFQTYVCASRSSNFPIVFKLVMGR